MSIKRPSAAMVVACTALFVALGGTGIAAVNYARNAGRVDGKSAVRAASSRGHAAGKLVATYRHGRHKGQLAHRFLAETPLGRPFGRALAVADNASSVPVALADTGSLGRLSTTCADQSKRPGVEDPVSTISFANDSGTLVNVATRVGVGRPQITTAAPGTAASVTIHGSNTFTMQIGIGGTEVLVDGVVRQDGAGTSDAHCLVYGTSLQLG